jgi:putative ABC transport system permease protein
MGLWKWSVTMAWRDARAGWRRLALFGSSIILGVCGLVAVTGLRDTLAVALENEAKAVLGADLELSGRSAFGERERSLFARLGGEQAGEVNFSTMGFFPRQEEARLVQVRAIEGDWPFYGALSTEPAGGLSRVERGTALVERSLLLQFDAAVGETIRLGSKEFRIAAALVSSPGEAAAFGNVLPRVFISQSDLEETGLLRGGSFARHKRYFRLPEIADMEAFLTTIRPELRELRLSTETVQERKQELGESLGRVANFLGLTGFVALLLGAVGVASALHLHVRPKLGVIATLRCLGAPAGAASRVFLWQGIGLGMFGAASGALAGAVLQLVLPALFAPLIPFEIPIRLSWPAVLQGFSAGLLTACVFTLWPLLGLSKVSPLRALRSGFEERRGGLGLARLGLGLLTLALLVALASVTTGKLPSGFLFAGAVVLVAWVLWLTSLIATFLAKRLGPVAGAYVVRQGVANLHRPQNRTVLLVSALGLGVFLVLSLVFVRGALLAELERTTSGDRPNLVLWDVQEDQLETVRDFLRQGGIQEVNAAPVVTMRILGLRGRTVEALMADPEVRAPGWRLRREYRTTFRDGLIGTEQLQSGEFTGTWDPDSGPVPISIEADMARDLGLSVGDSMVWDVQGLPVEAVVGSIRKVEWRGFSPNFFVVFPQGVLEGAPGFWLIAGRAPDAVKSAGVQRQVGRALPGVSVIDLQAVLDTFDTITRQIGVVVRFMTAFTVVTALIVLVGALMAGRHQRVREAVLLRTLGASRRQVAAIEAVEFAALGSLAAVVGGGLAWCSAYVLGMHVFRLQASPPWGPMLPAWLLTLFVTLLIGWASGRSVRNAPPLVVLRSE